MRGRGYGPLDTPTRRYNEALVNKRWKDWKKENARRPFHTVGGQTLGYLAKEIMPEWRHYLAFPDNSELGPLLARFYAARDGKPLPQPGKPTQKLKSSPPIQPASSPDDGLTLDAASDGFEEEPGKDRATWPPATDEEPWSEDAAGSEDSGEADAAEAADGSETAAEEDHSRSLHGYTWQWHWHGEVEVADSRPYLVQSVIPEVGYGVLSGQWGTYKSFITLDLSGAVMNEGIAFGQFPVRRQGGVLFVACEGETEVTIRLEAILKEKYPEMEKPAPFAWVTSCPRLLDPKATKILTAMIQDASEKMLEVFGLPVALVIVDTTGKAAQYSKGGEDNDNAIAKIIDRTLHAVAKACGLFVLGVDHFGKDVTVGTKGSSGKEDDVDVILAALGDKEISGQVTDTRLCLRKRRSGPNGQEIAYATRVVDMGFDQYGCPTSTLVIDWLDTPSEEVKAARDPWASKSLRLLRKCLAAVMADKGEEFFPSPDQPPTQAVDLEVMRPEFYKSYVVDGTEKQKADARQKAFRRAIQDAQDRGLIGVRVVDDRTLVWDMTPDGNGGGGRQ